MQIARVVSLPNRQVKVTLVENIHLIMPLEVALSWHLKPNLILSEDDWLKLTREVQQTQSFNRLLNWATLRPRSQAEYQAWATKKGLSQEQTQSFAARLQKLDLLDDAKFAAWWADNRQTFRPRSIQELKFEMRQKGLASQDIQEAVANIDETELLRSVATKYFKKLSSKPPKEQRQKLLAYLGRRGFSFSLARRAVEEIIGK